MQKIIGIWVLAAALAGSIGLAACGKKVEATMDRNQFLTAVKGKTQQEVIDAVGKPNSTAQILNEYWVYDNKTIDPITGKTDISTLVFFENGRVDRISY